MIWEFFIRTYSSCMHITHERLRGGWYDGPRPRRKSMRSLKLEWKVKTASNNMSHGIYASSVMSYTASMEYRSQGSSRTFSKFLLFHSYLCSSILIKHLFRSILLIYFNKRFYDSFYLLKHRKIIFYIHILMYLILNSARPTNKARPYCWYSNILDKKKDQWKGSKDKRNKMFASIW